MNLIHIDDLTNEQARQWLIANDREYADKWATQTGDLVIAVRENINDFGEGSQLGDNFVTLSRLACRAMKDLDRLIFASKDLSKHVDLKRYDVRKSDDFGFMVRHAHLNNVLFELHATTTKENTP